MTAKTFGLATAVAIGIAATLIVALAEPSTPPPGSQAARSLEPTTATAPSERADSDARRAQARRIAAEVAPSAALEGTVTDTFGRPLPGAWVRLETAAGTKLGDERAICDAAGRFRLTPGATLEDAHIRAGCRSYRDTRHAVVDGLHLTLRRLPIVTGIVTDPEGVPVRPPGQIELQVKVDDDGGDSGETKSFDAPLAPDGTFRCEGVAVGVLRQVSARVKGHGRGSLTPARRLELDRSEPIEIRVTAGATVEGTVLDARSRTPVANARVWCNGWAWEPDSPQPTARTTADGRFRLTGVEPQRHDADNGLILALFHLQAESDAHAPSRTQAFAAQWNDRQQYEFEVLLQRAGCSLHGTVVGLDDRPAGALHVHVVDALMNLHTAGTDRDGEFRFEGLASGTARLLAWPGELEQAARGTVARSVDLHDGSNRVELRLRATSGRLRGTVRDSDGRPVPGAHLAINYNFDGGNLRASLDSQPAQTDAAGVYERDGLPPGIYEIAPTTADDQIAQPSRHIVTVEAQNEAGDRTDGDDHRELDFVIAPALTISGRVDSGTHPIAELEVVLRNAHDGELGPSTEVDADGSFRLIAPRALYDVLLRRGERTLVETPAGDGMAIRLDAR